MLAGSMSGIQQINHNMRHLETVNMFLKVTEHPSVHVSRKFSSHHTLTLHAAGCMQPAGPDSVGYEHPLFCECQFLYLHAPAVCPHCSQQSANQHAGEKAPLESLLVAPRTVRPLAGGQGVDGI